MRPALAAALTLVGLFFGGLTEARAQARSIGIGPRFSFVRGDSRPDIGSTRYTGGAFRAAVSKKTAVEVSIDYRSHINESLTERIRDYPIQGSLLFYPVKSTLSPYLLFGIGSYAQRIDQLEDDQTIGEPVTVRKVGYHAGMGGEIRLGSRTSIHLDYRYTFIRFGSGGESSAPGAIPIPGLGGLQERLKLTHQGSMWTTGLTVYF